MAYLVAVLLRMKRQRAYQPAFEDWLFHLLLPLAAYVTFIVAALTVRTNLRDGLLIVAGAVLLLLLVGIYNAWDAVSYHVLVQRKSDTGESERNETSVLTGKYRHIGTTLPYAVTKWLRVPRVVSVLSWCRSVWIIRSDPVSNPAR